MPLRDIFRAADIAEALALLSRLPIRAPLGRRGAAAAWAYPLAGAIIALPACLVAAMAAGLGLPPALTAGLALATLIATTGALHEDGLADTADGLWGGWSRARRLEIMADSRIGTYGVLALIGSVGLRWSALATIADTGGLWLALIGAAAVSRAPMVAVMHALPHARPGGLSAGTGRPDRQITRAALAIALVLALASFGLGALPLALILAAITLTVLAIARARIGGQTGDILGATQQLAEIAALVFLAA